MLSRILGVFGWLGTALVLAAVVVRFVRPELQEVWNGLALGGLASVVLYILGQWREVMAIFSKRGAKYGTLSIFSVLATLGILIGLNYLADRYNKRWDLTEAKQYSLSDQTRKVLQGLTQPLQVKVFARDDDFARFRDRLGEYEYTSTQVKVEYIDVDREPALARTYEIQSYGTMVMEYGDRKERVTLDTEQDITNAIIKVVEGAQKKVYFVQGHGEKDPQSADQRLGYSGSKDALGRDNYSIESLVLAQQQDVPADASVVVVAGPETDYFAPEVDALRRYLNKGGHLLVMIDPPEGPDARPLSNILALTREWGFDVGNNVVVDVSGMGQLIGTGPSVPLAASYPSHPITDRFQLMTAYPLTRSVTPIAGGVEGRTPQTFIETSPRSWAESDLKALSTGSEVGMDEGKGDKTGPIPIGAAVSVNAPEPPAAPAPAADSTGSNGEKPPTPQTRLVVIGDSDFASNGALGIQGNRDLFVNTVNWLAQQENLIAIRPRDPSDRRVSLTADQERRIFYLTVLLIPVAIFGLGIYGWARRRG